MRSFLKSRSERGAAAIELALLLPLLVLLIFGMIEFSLLMYNRQVITNASREGARAGIVQRDLSVPGSQIVQEITDAVNQYCEDRLITFGAPNNPVLIVSGEGGGFGTDLTVRLTFNYGFLVLNSFGFDPVQLAAQTVMKNE